MRAIRAVCVGRERLAIVGGLAIAALGLACRGSAPANPMSGGDWIAFSGARSLTLPTFGIYLMRLDDGAVRPVTSSIRWQCTRPRWVRSGAEILFDRDPGWLTNLLAFGKSRDRELWIVGPDGRHLRPANPAGEALFPQDLEAPDRIRLAPNPRDPVASELLPLLRRGPFDHPDWSRDGSRLALASLRSRGGDGEIHVGRADGSGLRRLTEDGREKFGPSWCPDGRWIAFEALEPIGFSPPKLCTTPSDTTALRCLAEYDSEAGVHWSPDSRHLAFISDFVLMVADSDGGNLRRLARLNPGDDSGEVRAAAPDWSPDGQRLVFSSFVSHAEGFQVFTARVDGSDVTRRSRVSPRFNLIYDLAWRPVANAPSDARRGRGN
jgi:Tol biopolymer transport system component